MSVMIIPKQMLQDPELRDLPIEKLFLLPLNIRYVNAQIKYFCGQVYDAEHMMQDKIFHADPKFLEKRNKFSLLSEINEELVREVAEIIKLENHHYERGNWEYTDWSFRGGSWHPEDLFLESAGNRAAGHWKEMSVEFDPSKRGIGNRYTTPENPSPTPYWRRNPRHFAPLERDCCEDRRVQIPYKMGY